MLSIERVLKKYIVFEGNDGSGKTTVAKAIYDRLPGHKIYTKEPGSPHLPFCQEIRKLIIHGKDHNIDDITYAHLFYADAYENIRQIVKPALALGKWVVSDRSVLSNKAYWPQQIQHIHITNHVRFYELHPIVFYLKVSPEECLRRITSREKEINEFEKQHVLNKLDQIHWRYEHLVAEECKEIKNITYYEVNNEQLLQDVIDIVFGVIITEFNLFEELTKGEENELG